MIKRKVAEYYVAEGRAEWVGGGDGFGHDLLRLVSSHPKNVAAADRASAWWRQNNPVVCSPDPAVKFILPENPGKRWVSMREVPGEPKKRDKGSPFCVFNPVPNPVYRPGRKRPAWGYTGKKISTDDGREQDITVVVTSRDKLLPEISDQMSHHDKTSCPCEACKLKKAEGRAIRSGRVPGDADLLAEHVIRTEDGLRTFERAKAAKANNKLFPGWGRGEAGSCLDSERFRCYRWPERTPWF